MWFKFYIPMLRIVHVKSVKMIYYDKWFIERTKFLRLQNWRFCFFQLKKKSYTFQVKSWKLLSFNKSFIIINNFKIFNLLLLQRSLSFKGMFRSEEVAIRSLENLFLLEFFGEIWFKFTFRYIVNAFENVHLFWNRWNCLLGDSLMKFSPILE